MWDNSTGKYPDTAGRSSVTSNSRVPILVLNPSNAPTDLRQGEKIAMLRSVTLVCESATSVVDSILLARGEGTSVSDKPLLHTPAHVIARDSRAKMEEEKEDVEFPPNGVPFHNRQGTGLEGVSVPRCGLPSGDDHDRSGHSGQPGSKADPSCLGCPFLIMYILH